MNEEFRMLDSFVTLPFFGFVCVKNDEKTSSFSILFTEFCDENLPLSLHLLLITPIRCNHLKSFIFGAL